MSMLRDDDPREPIGTYQVWHKEGDGFRHVANVEADDLLTAVMMPYISEDDQHYRPVTHMIGDARETTYGDVIVNPKHFAFEIYKSNVCYVGFRRVDFLQEQFKAILSAKNNAGESLQRYEKHLNEATERAMARMQGKDGREI
jgi:hypothetical protein